MDQPPGQQVNRRDSLPCSPTATRACANAAFGGESSQTAARKLQSQPVTAMDESQEHEACVWDSASNPKAATRTFSPNLSNSGPSPAMTDQEITYDIYQYILDMMEPGGVDASLAFERASLQPPITPESLAELDMPRIINNPKLRHDVNFDRELHFRPNLDGSRGRQKLKSADQYWQALEAELFMYGFASQQRQRAADGEGVAYWERVLQASQVRLRRVFEAVRDILKTLVPDFEQKAVVERLDVPLLMQEIQNGVCDLIDLSNWLARVLKAHCAPMRDELVDNMRQDIQQGAMEGSNELLVSGLRQLLAILEAMKLDVANHQIRHMRPLLVDDAVNFQQRYNAHRIAIGKVNVRGSQAWLEQEMHVLMTETSTPSHVEALSSALVKDLLFNENILCPQTFYLDVDRLRLLRIELHSSIYHEICHEVLTEMVPSWVAETELAKAHAALRMTVAAIAGSQGRFVDRIENVAAEIVRILLVLEERYPPVDTSMQSVMERRLADDFRLASAVFDKHARGVCQLLLPKLKACVDKHIRLSALDLQDALVTPAPVRNAPPSMGFGAICAPARPAKPHDPHEDLVRRLTHMICLHWHVWSVLVYLAPKEDGMITMMGRAQPDFAGSSPTVPIAQAVYAPGKKWLPVGVTVTEVPSGVPATPSSSPTTEQSDMNPETGDPSSDQPSIEQQPA